MPDLEDLDTGDILHGLERIAGSITPIGAGPTKGNYDGYVGSLTEAVMDATHGLADIASALREVAEAIRDSK